VQYVTLDWKEWSEGWIKEGHFISYVREATRYYEYVLARDLAHYEYPFGAENISDGPTSIPTLDTLGPFTPNWLEITKGYNKEKNTNQVWQMIFGINAEVYIYVELPTDTHRHGFPKIPKPSATVRRVSHLEEWMSSFMEPTFITEHFLMRPDCSQVALSAYNPQAIDITDLKLNFFISKLVAERIGTVERGVQTPASEAWRDVLDKLYRRLIPHRPITLLPVTMPAEAPTGE